MEFWCHYCLDWYETTYCQSHFQNSHGQENVTVERLQARMECLGGLDLRDETKLVEEEEKHPRFVTNNFSHTT